MANAQRIYIRPDEVEDTEAAIDSMAEGILYALFPELEGVDPDASPDDVREHVAAWREANPERAAELDRLDAEGSR